MEENQTEEIISEMDKGTGQWKTMHMNLVIDVSYPPHIDRSNDPYISVFEETRKKLMEEDGHCWRCGTTKNLEAHHLIQWAYFTIIDGEKLKKDFPQYTGASEDEKQRFLNGPDNIRLLCRSCHTGIEGVHKIPDPLWRVRRYLTTDVIEPTVQVGEGNSIKQRIKRAAGSTTENMPETIRNPLANMKISASLRRLLR